MYNFSYFKEKDRQTILNFIEENPFAFMSGCFLAVQQVATQLPVLLEERNGELFFQGHIMRNTETLNFHLNCRLSAFSDNPALK